MVVFLLTPFLSFPIQIDHDNNHDVNREADLLNFGNPGTVYNEVQSKPNGSSSLLVDIMGNGLASPDMNNLLHASGDQYINHKEFTKYACWLSICLLMIYNQ